MSRLRKWLWQRVARMGAWVVRVASIRAAKACGCDGCRLLFDPRAQAAAIADMFGGVPAKRRADRRPS